MAFIQNQDDLENPQSGTTPDTTTPTSAPDTSGGGASPVAAPQAAAPKGSGRFTNIQKYINANQGAGTRLATGVGNKIESKVNPEVQKSQDNLSSLRQGIQAGQGKLEAGQQYNTQANDANFNAQEFAQNQDNVNNFNQYRTGQAFDEAALQNQAQTAQAQNLSAQQIAQQAAQQFGSEQGRQQLLKQTFSPGRNYSVGQQRLDNLFLQQAAPELQQIQGNLSNAQKSLTSTGSLLNNQNPTIQGLADQEQTLAGGIQTGINNRANDLVTNINSTAESVNKARLDQQNDANQQFQNLTSGKNISKDFANNLQLNDQDRLLNVLKNDGNIDDYLKFNNTMLTSPDQLATSQDRAKYDAISQLAGIDPNQRAIKNDTQVANAVDYNNKLRTDLDSAQQQYLDYINSSQYTGQNQGNKFLGQSNASAATIANAMRDLNPQDLDVLNNQSIYDLYQNAPLQNLYGLVNNSGAVRNANSSLQDNEGYRANLSKYDLLKNAYNDLANRGLYQTVNIDDPEAAAQAQQNGYSK